MWTLSSYAAGSSVISRDKFGSIKETVNQLVEMFNGTPEIVDLSYKSKTLSINAANELSYQYGIGASVSHN